MGRRHECYCRFPNKWYNASYGMQLSENTIGILGLTSNRDLSAR